MMNKFFLVTFSTNADHYGCQPLFNSDFIGDVEISSQQT